MEKQEKFYDVPSYDPPTNRRVYAAAKKPFGYLWDFVVWAGTPWAQALPFAMIAAYVVAALCKPDMMAHGWLSFAERGAIVGLLWTGVLGAIFAVVKALNR